MSIEFEKWKNKYYGEKIVDFSNFFKKSDIEILEKLEIKVDLTKIYTEYEYDLLDMELISYYEDAEYLDGTKIPHNFSYYYSFLLYRIIHKR